jgi:hypothetical protein
MAKRMQYMYRQWKCRKRRGKKLWSVNNAIMDRKRKKQTNVIAFIENGFVCAKTRLEFKKQLHLVYEKAWDTESGRMYWYNHHTKGKLILNIIMLIFNLLLLLLFNYSIGLG